MIIHIRRLLHESPVNIDPLPEVSLLFPDPSTSSLSSSKAVGVAGEGRDPCGVVGRAAEGGAAVVGEPAGAGDAVGDL